MELHQKLRSKITHKKTQRLKHGYKIRKRAMKRNKTQINEIVKVFGINAAGIKFKLIPLMKF